MSFTELKSPAKINVGLKIINKRKDGFHNLETIFYPVDLFDNIKISIEKTEAPRNSVFISSNKPYVPTDKKNFCYKIIEAFFIEYKIRDYYEIHINIEKNIPVGGGLGGGSSNAGTILRFLIDYFGVDVDKDYERIIKIALQAGSDVPFFVISKPCFAESRGEAIKLLENFKLDYNVVLVNPGIHISTKWAFEELNYQIGEVHDSLLSKVQKFYPENAEYFENDFEKIVFKRYSEIKNIKDELLKAGATFASLSGTGGTVYGLFEKKSNASPEILEETFDKFRKLKYDVIKT
jgi:4-diphosphocytidyl-2-C-methyl-D-erythritol kinase